MNETIGHSWSARVAWLTAAWTRARRNLWRVAEQGAAFAAPVDAWLSGGVTVSSDAISEVRRFELAGKAYYVKSYRQPGKGWRRWLGRSRIRTEWENLMLLETWGIPVPELVAYGEQWAKSGYRGAMVTEELPNTRGLDGLAERLRDRSWREAVLGQLADQVAAMHSRGFAHGDLNWRNVLVDTVGEPHIFLIDCPVGRIWPWPLREPKLNRDLWLLDKLGRRYLSRSQRLRFYMRYRGIRHLQAADKSRLRAIVAKTKRH